ncbi:MAG: phage tail protein [Micrococcales bacterium]|nr:phage tail protein [Micrococcales bacterium]
MASIYQNRSAIATDPIRNFRFLVTFAAANSTDTNLTIASATMGFTSVSGLAVTTDSIPYREGGFNTTVHQIPGQTSFQPITLQNGVVIGKRQKWDWMRNLFATVQGGATRTINQGFRCDVTIKVLAHPIPVIGEAKEGVDDVAMQFKVYNAWPTAVAYSDLNAGDNSLFVEQMTLVHEGFDASWSTMTNNVFAPAASIGASGAAPASGQAV